MIKSYIYFFIFCVCLGALSGASANHVEPETAVDVTTKDHHVQFPFYGNVRSVNPDLANAITKHTVLIIRYIQELIGNSLSGKKLGTFGWVGVSTKLVNMGRASRNARKGMDTSIGTNGSFNKDMRDMFKRMVAMSRVEETLIKNENEVDNNELKASIDKVFDGLVTALEASPVSQYYDWRGGEIDGVNFEVYISKLMAKLSKKGYSGIFGCIDGLLTWIARLGSLG